MSKQLEIKISGEAGSARSRLCLYIADILANNGLNVLYEENIFNESILKTINKNISDVLKDSYITITEKQKPRTINLVNNDILKTLKQLQSSLDESLDRNIGLPYNETLYVYHALQKLINKMNDQ